LFLLAKDGQLDSRLPAILDQVARESVRKRNDRPVLLGEVIQKENPVLAEKEFLAFYATLPVYYPSKNC
jgi:hypothetical protein